MATEIGRLRYGMIAAADDQFCPSLGRFAVESRECMVPIQTLKTEFFLGAVGGDQFSSRILCCWNLSRFLKFSRPTDVRHDDTVSGLTVHI